MAAVAGAGLVTAARGSRGVAAAGNAAPGCHRGGGEAAVPSPKRDGRCCGPCPRSRIGNCAAMAANAGFAEYHGFAVLGHDGVVAAALPLFERVRMGPGGLAAAGLGRGKEKGAQEGPERALSGAGSFILFRCSAVS